MVVRLEDQYRFVAESGEHQVIIDQPVKGGGTNLGMSPVELFIASLSGCVAYYAAHYMERNHIPAQGLRVEADWGFEKNPYRVSKIKTIIHPPPGSRTKNTIRSLPYARDAPYTIPWPTSPCLNMRSGRDEYSGYGGFMRGMIHVYTGDGKGKTTAAFGLAARCVGHGRRVLFVQFLKGGGAESGGITAGKRQLLGMEVMRFKEVHPLFDPAVDPKILAETVRKDFAKAERLILQGDFDLVILDEINNCTAQGLLPVDALLTLMESKPQNIEMVLTGRGAASRVLEKADYVTEMKKIKHPAETSGLPAREGIEY